MEVLIVKLNIFQIPTSDLEGLKNKLTASGMDVIKEVEQDGWRGEFYFSTEPEPVEVPWIEAYRNYFEDGKVPTNTNYFATFLFTRGAVAFALSHGKSHFYLRPYCNYDFGIELAKRIADELDIKQTASKRFQGKRKKHIRSFAANTRLDVESGESVDYIQAAVIESQREMFGKSGKFGTSALLAPDIGTVEIGSFLSKLEAEVAREPRFMLPRTTIISEEGDIERYDQLLVNELTAQETTTDFTHNSYDLYGIDFVFSNEGSFKLRCPGYREVLLPDLGIGELKEYISSNCMPRQDVLKIKIVHEHEGRSKYTQEIKQALDFIVDNERVLLNNGRWMRFNQDYLQFLNEYLDAIRVEETEPTFQCIELGESEFNQSPALRDGSYEVADKDFSIFRTRSSTPIEAWDLKKNRCVYAVKFGTAQKLGYVCDQATNVLEILRNSAGTRQIPDFQQYCLWLGYKSKTRVERISSTGSIILKQKIEAWARKCHELGIEPVLKISQKV